MAEVAGVVVGDFVRIWSWFSHQAFCAEELADVAALVRELTGGVFV
jgi:hypothetical protein